MATFATLAVSMCLSLATGATAESPSLVRSGTMQVLLGSVVVPTKKKVIATAAGAKGRALAAGDDECAVDAPLGIQDSGFSSTGCYTNTTAIIDGEFRSYLYTERGVEPLEDGTGWDQGVLLAVAVSLLSSPSSVSASSTGISPLNRRVLNSYTTSIGKPTSSIGNPTSTNPDDGAEEPSPSATSDEDCEDKSWKGDGECDPGNNNQGCEFDDGDCCECTCVAGGSYECGTGTYGFNCVDPFAPCANDDDYLGDCDVLAWNSDGFCDTGNNNAGCGYDGGDCCECSCVDTEAYACGDQAEYHCIDPDPQCSSTNNITEGLSSFNSSSSPAEVFWISTYIPAFSDQALDWTILEYVCVSSSVEVGSHPATAASWSCATLAESSSGSNAVYEEMPESLFSVQCDCNNTSTSSSSSSSETTTITEGECADFTWKNDGACDWLNNNAGCDYDGGDCCPCTCIDTTYYACSETEFNCLDPAAPCVDDVAPYNGTCLVPAWKTDGFCDEDNNNAGCDFDGGDCCECTCVPVWSDDGDDDEYTCKSFYCIDPDYVACVNETDSSANSSTSDVAYYHSDDRPTKGETPDTETEDTSSAARGIMANIRMHVLFLFVTTVLVGSSVISVFLAL